MNTLIINAHIIDGSGFEGFYGSVRLDSQTGLIVEIANDNLPVCASDQVIDGKNLILSPGFIDVHTHSDASALAGSVVAAGRLAQGVCSEIVGNCGLSAFPITRLNRANHERIWQRYNQPQINWSSYSDYQTRLQMANYPLRVFALTGHNTLRSAVAGYGQQELMPSQLEEAGKLLRTQLKAGALGLSTGLLYVPGKFANEAELEYLLKIVAEEDKIYATHLRSESTYINEALTEAITLCQNANLHKLHISHLKTAGANNFAKLDAIFDQISQAQKQHINITADRYPYCSSMTQLSVVLPDEYSDMRDAEITRCLQNSPETRAELLAYLRTKDKDYFQTVRLTSTTNIKVQGYTGLSLAQIARQANYTDPAELIISLLSEDSPGTLAAFEVMSALNLQRILSSPWIMPGCDETARPTDGSFGYGHPRNFGTMPEFIRQSITAGVPFPEVIRRMTALPAQTFGLKNLGLIREGYYADVILWDSTAFASQADFTSPLKPAVGIKHLWRSGRRVF